MIAVRWAASQAAPLGVVADHMAPGLALAVPGPDQDLLDLDLGRAGRLRDRQRHHAGGVGEYGLAHLGIAALAGAENVPDSARLQFGERPRADHAAVGDDADPADTEARTQAVDHRQQRLDVGDVARPGFRAEGTAVAVDDHADHHLFQFRPVVLGLAAPPERLATLAVEVEGGGIEEHQVEVVERVASSREQPLLHQVLDRPRRPGASLLVGQLLTQPGDRPVQVVQVDAVEPGNPVALRPLVAGPVGAGDAQPVQHAGEDRPLHRELEPALCQQPLDHRPAAGLAPQTLEDQRRADAPAVDQKPIAITQGGQHQGGFGQAGAGLQQLIELASVQPILSPPRRGDDMLPNGAAIAAALDDLQIRAPTNGFAAEEHAGLVGCTTPMHQTPAAVNAFYASLMALHFWPIFDSRPLRTEEIRRFPPASAAKTVELQLDIQYKGSAWF